MRTITELCVLELKLAAADKQISRAEVVKQNFVGHLQELEAALVIAREKYMEANAVWVTAVHTAEELRIFLAKAREEYKPAKPLTEDQRSGITALMAWAEVDAMGSEDLYNLAFAHMKGKFINLSDAALLIKAQADYPELTGGIDEVLNPLSGTI